jgi:hypothetical protein
LLLSRFVTFGKFFSHCLRGERGMALPWIKGFREKKKSSVLIHGCGFAPFPKGSWRPGLRKARGGYVWEVYFSRSPLERL